MKNQIKEQSSGILAGPVRLHSRPMGHAGQLGSMGPDVYGWPSWVRRET